MLQLELISSVNLFSLPFLLHVLLKTFFFNLVGNMLFNKKQTVALVALTGELN